MKFHATHSKEILIEARDHLLPQFRAVYIESGLNILIASLHANIDEALENAGLYKKATCSRACSFCCHDDINMPLMEAQYIKNRLKGSGIKPNKRRAKLQSNPSNKITFMDKACPMLMDENKEGERLCSIYAIRPLVCRTHNSTEDPKFCNKEEYPGRMIHEGRAVSIEAATLALVLLDAELKGLDPFNGDNKRLELMHKLKF